MKKLMLNLIILGALMTSFAQFEIKYNRFRHSREEYIEIGRDLAHSNSIDCNEKEAKVNINLYKSIFYSDTVSVESKQDALYNLSHTNCQEVIDFYENIIKNDAIQNMRNDALLYLGWLRAKSSIPFLLEVAKKENDLKFVIEIASTLCVMEEFELAVSVLDEICFNEDGSIKKNCIYAYEYAGKDELVRNYWLSEWEKENDDEEKFGIALRLIRHGIYDISFPIIKEALFTSNTYKRKSALSGLAAIATEEAIELIQNCVNDEDIVVANFAKFIITCLEEGRDYYGRRDK